MKSIILVLAVIASPLVSYGIVWVLVEAGVHLRGNSLEAALNVLAVATMDVAPGDT